MKIIERFILYFNQFKYSEKKIKDYCNKNTRVNASEINYLVSKMKIKPIYFLYALKALLRQGWRMITFRSLIVPHEEQEKRLAICMKCEHVTRDGQCDICGCYLKLKTLLIGEQCPDKTNPRW